MQKDYKKKITFAFPKTAEIFNYNVSKIKMFYNRSVRSWGIAKYNRNDFQIGDVTWVYSKKEALAQKKEWEKEFKI